MVNKFKDKLMLWSSIILLCSSCALENGSSNKQLYDAFERRDFVKMQQLINAGADISYRSEDIFEVDMILSAVMNSDVEMFDFLLANGANVFYETVYKRNLLSYVSNREIAKILLDKGVAVNSRDSQNNTPLHWAAVHGDVEIIKLLLEFDVDVNAKNIRGQTPIIAASMLNRNDGRVEIIKILLKHGAEVNINDSFNGSPLLYCAGRKKNVESLKLLLANGAAVNHVDDDGNSALHYAQATGNMDNLEFLINHGAATDIRNKVGKLYNEID